MKTRNTVFSVISINHYTSAALRLESDATAVEPPQKTDCWSVYKTHNHTQNVLTAKLAAKCAIQLRYILTGVQPSSINKHTIRTYELGKKQVEKYMPQLKKLTSQGNHTHLVRNQPTYRRTAAFEQLPCRPRRHDGFIRPDVLNKLQPAC